MRRRSPLIGIALIWSGGLTLATGAAQAFPNPFHPVVCVCQSPFLGCDTTTPIELVGGAPVVADLCVDLRPGPDVASLPSPTEEPCTTTKPGSGNEVCAWQVELASDPELPISGFVLPSPDLYALYFDASVIRLARVAASSQGEPISFLHLGTVSVAPTPQCGTSCMLRVDAKSVMRDAALEKHSVEPSVLYVPEPGWLSLLLAGLAGLLALRRAHAHKSRVCSGPGAARGAMGSAIALLACVLAAALPSGPARGAATSLEGRLGNADLGLGAGSVGLGHAIARIGDLDGDGAEDYVLGLPLTAPSDSGAAMLVLSYSDGSPRVLREIKQGSSGFAGSLSSGGQFGRAVASLGDLDGDGLGDIAVLAPGYNQVWILFLAKDGTLKGHSLIEPGTAAPPAGGLASLGDVDGDGRPDLAYGQPHVSCPPSYGSQSDCGVVEIMLLNGDGSLKSSLVIDADDLGGLATGDLLGASLAAIGDIDGNGVTDFVAGLPGASSGRGDVALIRLNAGGSVLQATRLVALPGFPFALPLAAAFGSSVAGLGDLDVNGVLDLAVGAPGLVDGAASADAGGFFLLTLDYSAAGTGSVSVLKGLQVDHANLGVGAAIGSGTRFGRSLGLVDVDADGRDELWVGAAADASGISTGLIWSLAINDQDGDGYVDFLDDCVSTHNSDQADADGDGDGDACDNCPALANPSQADSDDDGWGDACQPPVLVLSTIADTANLEWSLALHCNSASVREVNLGVVLSDFVTHANVEFGGGCDEPPAPVGGGTGCPDPPDPLKLGASVDQSVSGVFYIPGASNGERDDTLYLHLEGKGYAGNKLLCEPGSVDFLGRVEIVPPPPAPPSVFPRMALTINGISFVSAGYMQQPLFDGLGDDIEHYSLQLVSSSMPPQLELELKVVDGFPGQYQICFKSIWSMSRVSFALDPPYIPNTSTPALLTWDGCTLNYNSSSGRSECDANLLPQYLDPTLSFAIKPTVAFADGTTLDTGKTYVVMEGSVPQSSPFPPIINVSTGMSANDPSVCLGTVQVSGGSSEPPVLYVGPDLDDLPYGYMPYKPFYNGTSDAVLEDFWVYTVDFGLDDTDADNIADETDVCVYRPDPNQDDSGGPEPAPLLYNGIGDVCECGEAEGNGHMPSSDLDVDEMENALVGASLLDPDAVDRCNVNGDNVCDLLDVIVLDQVTNNNTTAGEVLQQSCAAANSL